MKGMIIGYIYGFVYLSAMIGLTLILSWFTQGEKNSDVLLGMVIFFITLIIGMALIGILWRVSQ